MNTDKYVVKHAALSDVGLKRSINEDSVGFIEIENGYLFVVCDGMGGHEGGEIASKTAVRSIIEYLNTNKIENVSISLHQAIIYANKQIYNTALNRPDLKGMGTTAVVLLIYKDEIYTANVGDSRIYVLTNKDFLQITKDHSVVQELVDNGIIQPSEADNHPRKNEITKALGVKQEVVPTINNKVLKAKVGDRFIICSDGLHGLILKEVFSKTIQLFSNLDECANKLIDLAKEAGGDDNISVQIIDISESPFKDSFYPTSTIINTTSIDLNLKEKRKKIITKKIIYLLGFIIVVGFALSIYKYSTKDKKNEQNIKEQKSINTQLPTKDSNANTKITIIQPTKNDDTTKTNKQTKSATQSKKTDAKNSNIKDKTDKTKHEGLNGNPDEIDTVKDTSKQKSTTNITK